MQHPTRRMFARATWLKVHVYLALNLGLLFALLGLSGSLNVYREELDALLNPQLVIAEPQGEPLSLNRIFDAVRAAHPQRYGSWTLEMPRSPHGMITAWFETPHETFGAFYAPLMVSVNPYTAEIVDNRFWGRTAATWLLDLHTQLLLDGFGWNSVGVLGLLLMASAITGVYLWWPGVKRLPQAFAIRHDIGLMRLLFDLHRLIGLCSAPALLLLACTGFLLTYPAVLETLADSAGMEHGDGGPDIRSTAIPNDRPVSPAEAALVARGPFPHAELRRITTPAGESGSYRINLRRPEEINLRHPFTTIWVDRWSGQILEARNPNKFSPGQRFAAAIWPVHTGEAFGAAGRLLWFGIGLLPLALYAGGLWHWLYRRGMVSDRQIDLPAQRRALAGYLQRHVYRRGQKYFHILYPLLTRLLERALQAAMNNATLAVWYDRVRYIVTSRKY